MSANQFVNLYINTFLAFFATYSVESEQKKISMMTAVDAYCQIKNGAHTHWVKQKNYEAIERKKYEHICGVHLNMHCKKYLRPVFNFRENSRTLPIKLSNKLRPSLLLIHNQQLVNEAAVFAYGCIQLWLCTLTVRL